MRLLCIDASVRPDENVSSIPLMEGVTYTLYEEVPTYAKNSWKIEGTAYLLYETIEWQNFHQLAFDKKRFIPLAEKETAKKFEYAKA